MRRDSMSPLNKHESLNYEKTTQIQLLFLTMLLVGCEESTYKRDFYKSKEDCLKDWNKVEKDCEVGNHQIYGGGYYGPHYYYLGNGYTPGYNSSQLSDGRTTTRFSNSAVASGPSKSFSPNSSTSRGGFGSTGRSYGGGISS